MGGQGERRRVMRRAWIGVVLLMCWPVAPARADEAVATDNFGEVAAVGDVVAFSTLPGKGYRLTVLDGGTRRVLPRVASASDPFDVDLGRDAKGHAVATYSRCSKQFCRIMQADPKAGGEQVLFTVPASVNPRRPVRWGSRVAYARAGRRASGCDAIAVRTFGAHPTTRVFRGPCGTIEDLDLEGTTIAVVSSLENDDSQTDYTLASLNAATGRSHTIGGVGEGADTQRAYRSVAISGGWITTIRTQTLFGSIDQEAVLIRARPDGSGYAGRQLFAPAGGEVALAGHTFYWTAQNGTLVRISQDPYGNAPRTLLPKLTTKLDPTNMVLSGRLVSRTVRNNAVTATNGVRGVSVQAFKEDDAVGKPFTTRADGSYSISIAAGYDDTAKYHAAADTTPVTSSYPPVSENGDLLD